MMRGNLCAEAGAVRAESTGYWIRSPVPRRTLRPGKPGRRHRSKDDLDQLELV